MLRHVPGQPSRIGGVDNCPARVPSTSHRRGTVKPTSWNPQLPQTPRSHNLGPESPSGNLLPESLPHTRARS